MGDSTGLRDYLLIAQRQKSALQRRMAQSPTSFHTGPRTPEHLDRSVAGLIVVHANPYSIRGEKSVRHQENACINAYIGLSGIDDGALNIIPPLERRQIGRGF